MEARKVVNPEIWYQGLYYEAQILTTGAKKWIDKTQQGEILHVFERTCNLINDHGEILSLVTSNFDAGPFAIVVEGDAGPFNGWLEAGEQVRVNPLELELGGRCISLRIAEHWEPRLPWLSLRPAVGSMLAQMPHIESLLHLHAPVNSLADLLKAIEVSKLEPGNRTQDRIFTQVLETARDPADFLCEGIVKYDIALIAQGARGLAGLGGGLTPAGDDYLMGGIYAAWLLHSNKRAKSIATIILDCAAPRTTRLSSAWLQAAQRGEAGMRWHQFFQALISQQSPHLQSTLQELVSVGHTSGADALSGFLGVLSCYQENRYA